MVEDESNNEKGELRKTAMCIPSDISTVRFGLGFVKGNGKGLGSCHV
jgi:hypothetical protein